MRFLLCLGLAAPIAGWVSSSQSKYGAQISEIQALMRGETLSRSPQAQLGYLWYAPQDWNNNTRGLGGGITWAWDENLCDMLKPQFTEDIIGMDFITCSDYKAAIARAFDKWAANNRNFKFLDVTEECKVLGKNYGPPTGNSQAETLNIPADTQNPPRWYGGTGHGACPLAEIWVTSMQGLSSSRRQLDTKSAEKTIPEAPPGLPPLVYDDPELNPGPGRRLSESFAVAEALPHIRYAYDFRYTNGNQPFYATNPPAQGATYRPVVEQFMGTFRFNTNPDQVPCWYLDGYFCSGFHKLKTTMGSASDAQALVYGVTLGTCALGVLFYAIFFCTICLRFTGLADAVDEDGDGLHDDDEDGDGVLSCSERVKGVLRQMSNYNPIILTFFVMFILIPPLVTTRLFAPCFDCYDFEAAALHEIGHFMGMGHPDNIPANWLYLTGNAAYDFTGPNPGNNSYNEAISNAIQAGSRPDPMSVCMDPWSSVKPGVPASSGDVIVTLDGAGYPTRDAQMEAFTQNNPQPCLREDDIEGLQVLYPDCTFTSLYTNVCHTVNLNIGFVRTGVYLLVPTIIALLCVVCFNSIIHKFERREKQRMIDKLSSTRDKLHKKSGGRRKSAEAVAAQSVAVEVAK